MKTMTAKHLKERLGPLASVVAVASGWQRSAWNTAVHREQELTTEQRAAYKAALAEHVREIQSLRKAL